MVLESTFICFDSSEYQRNGDYMPSRLMVQRDGVNLVCLKKLRENPESNVGLMTIAEPVQVLATLTSSAGHIFSKLHGIQAKGELNILTGLRIAHLALKHRQYKLSRMRIVAFIGSPLHINAEEFLQLAKKLRKEKVNVDIVSFGGYDDNDKLLATFIETLNGKDSNSSYLLRVPRGMLISSALQSSPILGEDHLQVVNAGSNIDFDMADDPDLALALRISMREEHERAQQRALTELADEASTSGAAQGVSNVPMEPDFNSIDFNSMTEEQQIAYAMHMSMQESIEHNIAAEEITDSVETTAASDGQETSNNGNTNNDPSRKRENKPEGRNE